MDFGTPAWLDNGKIDEVLLAREMLMDRRLIWTDGAFFDEEGRVSDEQSLRQVIYRKIRQYTTSNVSRKVENIFNVLKMEASGELPLSEVVLHITE